MSSPLVLQRHTLPTPVGPFVVLLDDTAGVWISNWAEREPDALLRLRRALHPRLIAVEDPPAAPLTPTNSAHDNDTNEHSDSHAAEVPSVSPVRLYASYFAAADRAALCSASAALSNVSVGLVPAAPLAAAAWEALRRVRAGETVTYAELAASCGNPRWARAVGRAMRENYVCVLRPCHRVVGAGHALTGFGCGLWRKAFLLRHEGAPIPEKALRLAEEVQSVAMKKRTREGK